MRGCEQDVTECADQGEEDDGDAALLGAVCDVGGCDDEEEGDEVGGRGEALGVDGGEAHFGEDGREEDGEGGEGDVAGEVHQRCEVVLFPRKENKSSVSLQTSIYLGGKSEKSKGNTGTDLEIEQCFSDVLEIHVPNTMDLLITNLSYPSRPRNQFLLLCQEFGFLGTVGQDEEGHDARNDAR